MIAKLGPDHPDTLTALNNLAAAYWKTKQLEKSVPLFEDVLKRKQAKLGRRHPDTLLTVANLGVNYKDAGRLKEAIPLLEEAHQAAKTLPDAWLGRHILIDAYAKAGENAKLADLVQEQLREARKALPKDSPQLAGLLAQIGLGLLEQKKWTEAEPLLRECLAIREKSEPDVWSTFNTKSLLGGALLGQKKYAEAEPLLLAGYEGMKQREKTIPEQAKSRLPRSPRSPHRTLHRDEQAGRSQEVAGRAGEVSEKCPDAGGEKVTGGLPVGGGSDSFFLLEQLACGSAKRIRNFLETRPAANPH